MICSARIDEAPASRVGSYRKPRFRATCHALSEHGLTELCGLTFGQMLYTNVPMMPATTSPTITTRRARAFLRSKNKPPTAMPLENKPPAMATLPMVRHTLMKCRFPGSLGISLYETTNASERMTNRPPAVTPRALHANQLPAEGRSSGRMGIDIELNTIETEHRGSASMMPARHSACEVGFSVNCSGQESP
jgi:hypothetical protein